MGKVGLHGHEDGLYGIITLSRHGQGRNTNTHRHVQVQYWQIYLRTTVDTKEIISDKTVYLTMCSSTKTPFLLSDTTPDTREPRVRTHYISQFHHRNSGGISGVCLITSQKQEPCKRPILYPTVLAESEC